MNKATLERITGPTLVTTPDPADLSPIEAAIMDRCNELHESVAVGNAARTRLLRSELDDLLDRYERTGAEAHPNPDWAVPNQRALVLSAAGEIEGAIEAELEAMQHADTPRRREISAGNLAERHIRLGDYVGAISWFIEARSAAPESIPIMLTGAQALFLGGYGAQANRIFARLLQQAERDPSLVSGGGELAAYLDFESRLAGMAPDLPALHELMSLRARVRAAEARQKGDTR